MGWAGSESAGEEAIGTGDGEGAPAKSAKSNPGAIVNQSFSSRRVVRLTRIFIWYRGLLGLPPQYGVDEVHKSHRDLNSGPGAPDLPISKCFKETYVMLITARLKSGASSPYIRERVLAVEHLKPCPQAHLHPHPTRRGKAREGKCQIDASKLSYIQSHKDDSVYPLERRIKSVS